MTIVKSVLPFALAAAAEIGGAWLIWQAVREDRAWWWAGLGVVALGIYGFVAAGGSVDLSAFRRSTRGAQSRPPGGPLGPAGRTVHFMGTALAAGTYDAGSAPTLAGSVSGEVPTACPAPGPPLR